MVSKYKCSGLVFLLLILFFLYYIKVHTFFSYLSYPVLKLYTLIESVEYKTKKKLYQQLQELQKKNNKLLSEYIRLSAIVTYIHDTESIRNFSRRYDEDIFITNAQVLVKHMSQQEQFFLIDVGQRDGIVEGMGVVYYNQAIGTVEKVFNQYAKVCLITDKKSRISAFSNQTNAKGVVKGVGKKEQLLFAYVSHMQAVIAEDIIFTAGDGMLFPKGFALGKIISISNNQLYHDITITPLFDFSEIDYCSILS